jgi:hypothetical protein
MNDLQKFQAVNKTKTLQELADVIRSFADEDGMVQDRTKKFDAEQMAKACENYNLFYHNALTKEFGIRQQALMIVFYKDLPDILSGVEQVLKDM